jgi:hypothetical protein
MFKGHHEKEQSKNMDEDSNHARKPFSDPVHQSPGGEGERAPSDGERAYHQTDDGAVSMKGGIGGERQIRAQAEAAEEGEERRRDRRRVASMAKEMERQNRMRRPPFVPNEEGEQNDSRGNERGLDQPDLPSPRSTKAHMRQLPPAPARRAPA